MAGTTRSELWQLLKSIGYPFTKGYKEYTTEELEQIHQSLLAQAAAKTGVVGAEKDQEALAVHRTDELEPIRTDAQGRVWYQEEIQKSSLAKPRGYRVFREMGTGTKMVTTERDAEGYTETIEVADGTRKPLEVKVGIPTWQVGIYKDPQFPFKVVVYRDNRGFYRQDVEEFFGGPDVLPEGLEKTYVGNLLAYPIRETVVAIQREFNALQKRGAVV